MKTVTKQRIYKTAIILSILYLVLIFAGYLASKGLPSLDEVRDERANYCYWTDAMIGYVECGVNVPHHAFYNYFYNYWIWFVVGPQFLIMAPVRMLIPTIILYAPVVFLIIVVKRRYFS